MSKYFLSYGTRQNEYQVWCYGLIKIRSPNPKDIISYIQLQKKENPDVELIGIGEMDELAKKINEALSDVQKS